MSSSTSRQPRLVKGDLLNSSAQTLVNTVNCVGVMGKGIAAAFKKRYPKMFEDYVQRCDAHEVKLGKPYVYYADDHVIVNFPTKDHWRSVSRLADIESGLDYLRNHLAEWGIDSIAVPPLGCGNGQLEWSVVGPVLYRHLDEFPIPVDLYVPHDVDVDDAQTALFAVPGEVESPKVSTIDAASVALVEILARIESQRYRWPMGRILFQKLAYFATASGIPTGLEYEANSYGPYAPELRRKIARLQNNGLVEERKRGRVIETSVGPTFESTRARYEDAIHDWEYQISRVVDLVARFNSHRAEVAGSVHFVAYALQQRFNRPPAAAEVIDAVEAWKMRRDPPLERQDIARAIVELATQRWVNVVPDETVEEAVAELEVV